jgi:methylaspartate ammonia-lyase
MKIVDVLHTVGLSGSYNKDLAAVRAGNTKQDGFLIVGKPLTPGFESIVQPGAAVSVLLMLEDGQVAFGDCMDVILSGAAGRDPLFRPKDHEDFLTKVLPDLLRGRDVARFRDNAGAIEAHREGGKPIHTALRYGVSQALLQGAAMARRLPMARVIAEEYGCAPATSMVPVLISAGTMEAVDRRIIKKADILPHLSCQNVDKHIGRSGEILSGKLEAIVRRIREIGAPGYKPGIHVDLYGTLGELFSNDVEKISAYIGQLEKIIGDHAFMVESPIIAETRAQQIELYTALAAANRRRGGTSRLIVDEWCNNFDDVKAFSDARASDMLQVKMPDIGSLTSTIESVLYAKSRGLGVSLGGSLNETDQSARIAVHVAIACQPDYIFARPGNGGDEALMIIRNEMLRTLKIMDWMAKR